MSPQIKWLLTGVTGGLGAKILSDLLHVHKLDPTSIIATARSEHHRARFEAQGVHFRVADYDDDVAKLTAAFTGVAAETRTQSADQEADNVNENGTTAVENLLFVSSAERDNAIRGRQHANVIAAARASGVRKVWYTSLAFGGWGDGSRIGFQIAHYETEEMLQRSGLDFVSLRAGVYADAFPLFLNWYPSSEAVLLPRVTPPVEQSRIAFTTRDELGEGMATLFARGLAAFPSIQPETEKNIVLLTATRTNSLVDLVDAIGRGRGAPIPVRYLEPREWIDESAKDDVGGKGTAWFEARLVFTEGVCAGDAEVTDPALRILLGREPETGVHAVERMIRENRDYTWHQNHVR